MYFKTHKPLHNLIRARNQFRLAQSIQDNLPQMNKYVQKLASSYKKKR